MASHFWLLIFFLWFLPFIVAPFGRDSRWKGLAMALCLATMLASPGSDILTAVFWLGAWVSAMLAIAAWFRPKVESRSFRPRVDR
jgi:hypothetical protein